MTLVINVYLFTEWMKGLCTLPAAGTVLLLFWKPRKGVLTLYLTDLGLSFGPATF